MLCDIVTKNDAVPQKKNRRRLEAAGRYSVNRWKRRS